VLAGTLTSHVACSGAEGYLVLLDDGVGECYRRIARRRGTKRAIVAVGRSILIIIWHLLSDPTVRYQDLGSGFYDTPDQR
jgi:hypothetical protein